MLLGRERPRVVSMAPAGVAPCRCLLVSDPDIERDGSDAMYRAPVATLGLELYEMPVKLSGRGA